MSEALAAYGITSPYRGSAFADGVVNARYGRCRCAASRGHSLFASRSSGAVHQSLVRERRPGRETGFSESILHAAWRKAGAKTATVSGRDGRSYRIIYPGRPADGAGPDFRDAVLLRDDGVQVHGDVEVHVRSGDWYSHGHGKDRAYNGVVLHVALEETGAPVQTMSGIRIPLLLLNRSMLDAGLPGSEAVSRPVEPADPRSAVPLPFLDMAVAGDEWFRNRVHGSILHISTNGSDQALWEGALECLGYPANKRGFRQLAARLDWETVTKAISEESPASLLDLFLWAGGFDSKPVGAPRLNGPLPEWSSRHGRPANHPGTRLRAAAVWAARWHMSGGPTRTFKDAVRLAHRPHELLAIFTVPAEQHGTSPLGRARAADVVINQMLPAVYALALGDRNKRLVAHTKQLFEAHPPLQSNSVTREASGMLRLRGRDSKPRTAREQQGLIHIYRLATARQQPQRQLPLL